ncbi:FAD/NAD(P)-binding domain-containing protein [Aspergillus coremiiformis]|uniref:FAD/NAD(P)-binding domain-containing protein n=1 Tax=Aspergillus coremiiformis TaxID=138285 RepID=A0A5N6Z659_9EURO|nr:FAD/NAD(P)-binding domain-containing protein [Aspergillus coremiiformis]
MPDSHPKRVAIVGGGCTGITCFWALQHSVHEVHLFEASESLGGRIQSLQFEHNGKGVDVNTESPSFNAEASPNLESLLRCLGISTSAVPFSFSASNGVDTYDWCGGVLRTIFLHPWMLCNLGTYRLVLDIIWFNYLAVEILVNNRSCENIHVQQSLSTLEYLWKEGYSRSLCDKYLAPLLSTLWGTNVGRLLPKFPARTLVRCLWDHKLFGTRQTLPDFRRIDAGTSHFIQIMSRNFPSGKVHVNASVRKILRVSKKQSCLITADGMEMHFDHIVFAVDNHEIRRILGANLDIEEREIIQGLRTATNIAVLHSDPLLAPNIDRSWPASNYIIASTSHTQHGPPDSPLAWTPRKSSLTYNVNSLQDIPTCLFDRLYITLNPFTPPHPRFAHGVWEFTDPELSTATLVAQSHLPLIQNRRGLSYGFRWTGRGFLEDAVTSGLQIAVEHLGASVPFEVQYHPDPLDLSKSPALELGLKEHLIRTVLCLIRVYVLIFEISWILLGAHGFPVSKIGATLERILGGSRMVKS